VRGGEFLGTAVPEEYGGEGLRITESSAVVEKLTRNGCFGSEMPSVANIAFGAVTPTEHGSEQQKAASLEPLVDGELNFCMALTESGAVHNAPNVDTDAEETETAPTKLPAAHPRNELPKLRCPSPTPATTQSNSANSTPVSRRPNGSSSSHSTAAKRPKKI
jgi:hypothetical protein